ncbi:MAG: HD domain-containing protein [Roseivirga sp.]
MSNELHAIDVGILVSFLTATLIVGIQAGRKMTSFSTYAVGDKNFSTAVITATIIATWISGERLFYLLPSIHTDGLLFIVIMMGMVLNLLSTGQILAIRMEKFLHYLSVGEAMGDLYGPLVRVITAISGILGQVGTSAIQFQVVSRMITLLLGLQGPEVMIASATIVILYSTFGGIRAVTMTDVLQFIVFSMFIPILALNIWNNLPNPEQQVTAVLATEPFDLRRIIDWNSKSLSSLDMLLYFIIPSLGPAMFQRILIARDVYQVKRSFTYAAGIDFLIILLVTWLAILLLADNPGLESSDLISYVVDHYAYIGLRGLMVVGIMALAMSTADSELNSSSVLAVHDLLKPIFPSFNVSITTARICSVFIGTAGLLLALRESDILALIMFTASFYMPVVTVPLLLAIFGFRSSPRAALVGMVAGIITVLAWDSYLTYTSIPSFLPGMLANLVALMSTHYLLGEEGGWQPLEKNSPLAKQRADRQAAWQAWREALRNPQPYAFLKQNLPTDEKIYSLIGLYVLGATYVSFFSLPDSVPAAYPLLFKHLTYSVLIVASALLSYPAWPQACKKEAFLVWAWPISMAYLFFFVGALLLVISGFHHLQVLLFVFNLTMATLLISQSLLFLLAFSGALLAMGISYLYAGEVASTPTAAEILTRFAYFLPVLVGVLTVFFLLFRQKQAYSQLIASYDALLIDLKNHSSHHDDKDNPLLVASAAKNNFFKSVRQIERESFYQIARLSQQFEQVTRNLDPQDAIATKVRSLLEELAPISNILSKLDLRAADYHALQISSSSVASLLRLTQQTLQASALVHNVRFEQLTDQKTVQCDKFSLMMVLMRSVPLLRTLKSEDYPIVISVEDTQLYYMLDSARRDHLQQAPALCFSITTGPERLASAQVHTVYMDERPCFSAESFTPLPLLRNKQTIDAHYGYSDTLVRGAECSLQYTIPVEVASVRPPDIEEKEISLAIKKLRTVEDHPGVMEREQGFFQAVSERTSADMHRIRQAVETVKLYHGLMRRPSGEPLYIHLITVAQIVLEYSQEEATVLGALFHESIRGDKLLLEHIALHYEADVNQLIKGMRELERDRAKFYTPKWSATENIKPFLELGDVRIMYIKLADRLHDMRTIRSFPAVEQFMLAEETLWFLLPLSRALGLEETAEELERLSLRVLTRKSNTVKC